MKLTTSQKTLIIDTIIDFISYIYKQNKGRDYLIMIKKLLELLDDNDKKVIIKWINNTWDSDITRHLIRLEVGLV